MLGLILAGSTSATVFINEVSINPPGSLDDFREFIELYGTPGKKLDGYAIALLNGTDLKYYPPGSIPPLPNPLPEIDEFFSLDGLSLGPNGLLVIAIAHRDNYPEMVSDTAFVGPWTSLWNGGLDTPGKLQNDGSSTILLIRNRPGQTQADPGNPGGLRWGKSIRHDFEIIRGVVDPQDDLLKDQFGDGDLDEGQPSGFGGTTLDMCGIRTPMSVLDDLEVVDEVSFESERGWEYDLDARKVDVGSIAAGLPERRVHALDDPQGFNPDSLTRVDHRMVGIGWLPAAGGVGQMANGRNWQDTATEQWIRGENTVAFSKDGPTIYYDNSANTNPDAIQPYNTHVPRWLADGVPPDYSFSIFNTYRLMAGRLNPLAIPYVPGDVNRDGRCDQADIEHMAAVFGDDNWIFSNSFATAPRGNRGNPADQIRPWDVDQTGDNGIEASDLQWVLNFQGSDTGRIRGLRYDSAMPATTGTFLNPNTGVICTVSIQTAVPPGRALNNLHVGDEVVLFLRGQVTSGANNNAGQTNGIMQFVHDVIISQAGILSVVSSAARSSFVVTRPSLVQPVGPDQSGGLNRIHGYTRDFSAGIGSAAELYEVRLRAVGLGAANIAVVASREPKFAASTPRGLKVGHTQQNGNPAGANYPPPLALAVTTVPEIPGDCDADSRITLADYGCFYDCFVGLEPGGSAACLPFDFHGDGNIDLRDFAGFQNVFSGE